MADPWNSATFYSWTSEVTYNGLTYVRSQYPMAATSGTPPSEEMSIDPQGDPIRTWTIFRNYINSYDAGGTLIPRYFRLVEDWDYVTKNTAHYQGMTKFAQSAYDNEYFNPVDPLYAYLGNGYTADMDQDDDPYYASVPADKCGVALQQYQEIEDTWRQLIDPQVGIYAYVETRHDLILQAGNWIEDPTATQPFTWYVFLLFNHPLYFRRNIKLAYAWTDYSVSPPVTDIVTKDVIPTDANYCMGDFPNNGSQSYFQPSNAVWTFALSSASGVLGGVWVKDVESND
jgi:hypothetical protein